MENLRIVGWTSFENEYPSKQYTQDEFNFVIQLIRE